MRWIVASLVLVNIVVFLGFQFFSGAEPAQAAQSNAAIGNGGAPGVQLLGEQSVVKPVESVRERPVPSEPSKPIQARPEVAICSLVGPFKELLKAEYFTERLQALGLVAEIKNLVVASDPGYWLHLVPESSRKEALRRLSELQRRGIDSYVIPSGNLANGISLGMFSSKERAEAMQQQIAKQGYKPIIVEVPREQKEIWVFLPQGESSKLDAEQWSELISADEYLQKRQNLCSDVAPA